MADMIEIMARAIVVFWGEDPDRRTISGRTMAQETMPLARAVRDAIREPTEAMTEAGATGVPIPMSTPNEDASRLVYQANIDAMKAEGENHE